MSQTQKILELNGRKITLIGTAHVSAESVKEVRDTILEQKPDCVAVELDQKRHDSIKNPEKYRELDIINVLRKKEGFLLLANLVMAAFQKRTGQKSGVTPGAEMLAALNAQKNLEFRPFLQTGRFRLHCVAHGQKVRAPARHSFFLQ